MFITIIFIFPLISHQNQIKLDKTLQLPLYQDNLIDIIDESGYIYKYHITSNQKNQAQLTYCQARPQSLEMRIEQQLKVTHKTEQDFEINFVNGKFYGQSEFIQSAVINNYGIIILTSDKNLTFISHQDINQNIAQTEHFQINESIENSYLIQIEELNLLILLLQSNTVYEYEIHNNTYYNKSVQFINNYKQEIIKADQIKWIKVYSIYIFILSFDGNLTIYNSKMEQIYQFESKVLHFEFEIIAQQFKIYLLYQNTTLLCKNMEFDNQNIQIEDQPRIMLTKPKAVSFKLYDRGVLMVIDDDNEGHIIIDYKYDKEILREINMQYISQKVRQIVIHDIYALLIGEKTQFVITIGVDDIYLNQQNYKMQANILVPQILDVLKFTDVTSSGIKDYIYAYTRTQFLKLNLSARKFEIFCGCQSQEEALKSPYHYELEYYNSKCEGCQKQRTYKLFYKFAIITKEDESKVIGSIVVGVLSLIGILGIVLYKYLVHIRLWKRAQERAMKLETTNTSAQIEFSINDSKIAFELEKKSIKQQHQNQLKQLQCKQKHHLQNEVNDERTKNKSNCILNGKSIKDYQIIKLTEYQINNNQIQKQISLINLNQYINHKKIRFQLKDRYSQKKIILLKIIFQSPNNQNRKSLYTSQNNDHILFNNNNNNIDNNNNLCFNLCKQMISNLLNNNSKQLQRNGQIWQQISFWILKREKLLGRDGFSIIWLGKDVKGDNQKIQRLNSFQRISFLQLVPQQRKLNKELMLIKQWCQESKQIFDYIVDSHDVFIIYEVSGYLLGTQLYDFKSTNNNYKVNSIEINFLSYYQSLLKELQKLYNCDIKVNIYSSPMDNKILTSKLKIIVPLLNLLKSHLYQKKIKCHIIINQQISYQICQNLGYLHLGIKMCYFRNFQDYHYG
ncbi:unnamed protein product [Paramecium sonneborni]|uniref:Transmembrane protein n=1 Tax=Paramecium sonneborni TaxID=65129 RepID=A0A8S1M0H9_9CILI|nr:unnamed protein product [Paramecium sonneborni]